MPAASVEDQKAVEVIYNALWALVESRTTPEQFPDFVAIFHPENIVELAGNTDGLLLLAAYALRTAMAEHEGYHEHIDEAAFANAGSVPANHQSAMTVSHPQATVRPRPIVDAQRPAKIAPQ